jgi:formate hydrogenlyase transcriptional activator
MGSGFFINPALPETAARFLSDLSLQQFTSAADLSHATICLDLCAGMSTLDQPDAIEQEAVERERDRLRLLLDITNLLVANRNFRELFVAISGLLRRIIHHDYAALILHSPSRGLLRVYALDFPSGKGLLQQGESSPIEGSPAGYCFSTRQPLLIDNLFGQLTRFPSQFTRQLLQEGILSGCWLPLVNRDRVLGVLSIGSKQEAGFSRRDVDLLTQVANQAAIAVDNALAFRQIAELNRKLALEKRYLENEIRTEYNFDEIVGVHPSLKRILRQVETVAPTSSNVLILGETGTGKELIARAIHNLGSRRERTFVKLNCAAIPTGLLESELFGHEKGAFTGAISQKLGRLELANKGTLFLDEVGDIPLELQPKLLRALQEKEFERIGGTRTIHVDVRLIAATNRDLAHMVARREFRSDLYYRLNVFPIQAPPLRERSSDIPLLVQYFVHKHAAENGKHIERVPTEAMDALLRWSWPGNIRELENFIERAVILSEGPVLNLPLAELRLPGGPEPTQPHAAASRENEADERARIVRVLKETRGVIAGPTGAAARLGLKRTTLNSRIRKLGITRDELWA